MTSEPAVTFKVKSRCRRTTKFDVVTHIGRGLIVFRVSHASTARGRGPSAPQFWQFPSIYAHTLCRRTTKFDVVIHTVWGRGVYFGISHTFHLKESRVSTLPCFGVLLNLCLHPLTQNDQIWHGNTWGGACLKRSVMPCHLHKCVARFVSNI